MSMEGTGGLPLPRPQVCQFNPLAGEVCIASEEPHDEGKGASPSNEKGAPTIQHGCVVLSPTDVAFADDDHLPEP